MSRSVFARIAAATVAAAAVASLAPSASFAASGSRTLNVRPQQQIGENWCWATTGLTVVQYFGLGSSASQNDFCNAGKGNAEGSRCPDVTGSIGDVQRGLRFFGASGGSSAGVISFDRVVQGIDGDSPMPAGYYWSAGGGHMVTIVGYDADRQDVYVNNSLRGAQRQSWINYDAFVSNDEWRWSDTIYGITGGRNANVLKLDANEAKRVDATPAKSISVASVDVKVTAQDSTSVAKAAADQKVADRVLSLFNQKQSIESISVASISVADVKLGTPEKLFTLNPDFVKGESTVIAREIGLVSQANVADKKAVVQYNVKDGQANFASVTTGDDEVRYAAMADGGVVFREPQINAWYRLKDGKVTALNDEAKAGLSSIVVAKDSTSIASISVASVGDYQKLVAARYADKMAGSAYQREGNFS